MSEAFFDILEPARGGVPIDGAVPLGDCGQRTYAGAAHSINGTNAHQRDPLANWLGKRWITGTCSEAVSALTKVRPH